MCVCPAKVTEFSQMSSGPMDRFATCLCQYSIVLDVIGTSNFTQIDILVSYVCTSV